MISEEDLMSHQVFFVNGTEKESHQQQVVRGLLVLLMKMLHKPADGQ